MGQPNWANRTIWTGDNLDILRGMNSESVDLIYLDPPFNSNRNFAAPIGSKAAGAAFKDTWYLSDLDVAWMGLIAETEPALFRVVETAGLAHGKGMQSYLCMMAVRLTEMRRVLRDTGSIYLHCDPTASHYLKTLMDVVFGKRNYQSEIVWSRASKRAKGSQHESRRLGRDTDTIFHYSKTDKHVHHAIYRALEYEELIEKFPHVNDDGRRYNTGTPLFCQPSMGDRPNLCYTYKGVTNPHPSGWRVSKAKLKEMDDAGDIIWRDGLRPLRKSYADEYRGRPIGSLWDDIDYEKSKERTAYPTQKPLALLERIIELSTDETAMILDPFCGCATACVAAEKLNRQWTGIDLSDKAAQLVVNRIKDYQGLFQDIKHRVPPLRRTDIFVEIPYRQNKHILYGAQQGDFNGCGTHFEYKRLEVDHIVPQSKGGTDHVENLQLLCSWCNRIKGDRSQEYLMARLAELEETHVLTTQKATA